MAEQIIEIEADSLEEARNKLGEIVPEGFCIVSETILSNGKPKTVKASANTVESAFTQAQYQIPINADILESKELASAEYKIIEVKAFDETTARSYAASQAISQLGNTAMIRTFKLHIAGKRGFLGIGRKPHQYEAEIFRPAVVEVSYRTKAKVSVKALDAASFEEQRLRKEREEEERRREEEYEERISHWRGLEDDEAWRDAHPFPFSD